MRGFSSCAKFFLLFIVALFLSATQPLFAHDEIRKELRTVKVAYFYSEGFQEISPIDGHRFGYGYDFLQNVAYYAGWKYEYIDTNWGDALSMLENGEVDILAEVSKTPEREKKMLFADRAMGTEEYYIFTQPDSSTINAGNLASLNGKLFGINAGTYQHEVFHKWVNENNIQCKVIEYQNEEERNNDFLNKKLDAVVAFDFYLDKGWTPLLNIGNSNYYIAVAPERNDILEELNEAQAKLFECSPLFIESLQNIYFPHIVISKKLNPREAEWLENHTKIHGVKIGYVDNYLPYCSKNKETGELEGVLTVFIDKLKEVFGIEVEAIAYPDRDELYEAVRKNEICACFPLYSKLWQTEELGIMQTEPIIEFPQAFVFRMGEYNDSQNMENLAVSNTNKMHTSYIRDNYPGANITFYKSYSESLKAISEGEVSGMFINTFILARLFDVYQQYKNLDVIYMQTNAKLCLGISFAYPELLSIFNKTAHLLDEAILTSSLVHNSQVERSYSLRHFLHKYSFVIFIFIISFSSLIILVMRIQISRIRAAKQQAEKAKQKAERLNSELEFALTREKESKTAVREAFEAANKANIAKTEFLSGMKQNIQTPMNKIIGMTELAAENLDDKEKIHDCISEINASSKQLLDMINEVVD